MIHFHQVTKTYTTRGIRKTVLDNLTVTFAKGETVGILGKNGAGKSTLLRLASCTEAPTSGRVRQKGSVSWPLGLSGGFQGSLTGRQNVNFVARLYGHGDRLAEIAAYVQSFSELGDYFEVPVKKYSSGMRSRLAFALSMAFQFDYYIVDEITAVGDLDFRTKSLNAFRDLHGRGVGMLFVSHSLEMVRQLCTQAYCLRDGQLLGFDTVNDAIRFYQQEG